MLAKSKSADVWSCKGRKRILSDGEKDAVLVGITGKRKDAVLGICSGAGMYNEENSKRRQEMGKGREWHK